MEAGLHTSVTNEGRSALEQDSNFLPSMKHACWQRTAGTCHAHFESVPAVIVTDLTFAQTTASVPSPDPGSPSDIWLPCVQEHIPRGWICL